MKLLKQASYVSEVTEFKGDRNINDVLVESIASHVAPPPSICAGR